MTAATTTKPAPATTPRLLEQRVVSALTDDTLASNTLASLLDEVTTSIEIAVNDAKVAERIALDPLQSPDLAKARAVMEDAKFRAERLRSLLPRLQDRLDEVVGKEAEAAWSAAYDKFRPERDAFEEELRTTYAECINRLLPLLQRLASVNAEANRINAMRPSRPYGYYAVGDNVHGTGRWMQQVKQIENLTLPDPNKPNEPLWPLPVNYFIRGLVPHMPNPGADWHATLQAENARRKAEDIKRTAEQEEKEAKIRNNPALWKQR
jgi:hypothetical protein